MQVANDTDVDVFGLYELSGDGTVLYSRPRNGSGLREPSPEVVGRDFFRDVARFENIEDLRRHFRRFLTSDRPVDTFTFDCLFDAQTIRAKIFLTRAFENDYDHAGGIVIMDIRQAAQ